jgi:hypothetical protein
MRRREIWGAALIAVAALAGFGSHGANEVVREAAGRHLVIYIGVPGSSIVYPLLVLVFLAGAAGTLLLAPSLISRIPRDWVRRTVGWTLALAAAAAAPFLGLTFFFAVLLAAGSGDYVKVVAPDGRSVLVTQDDFDGDMVDIYTERDELHYKRFRSAPEIAGWPRVRDQDCRLETANGLHLVCGATTLEIRSD